MNPGAEPEQAGSEVRLATAEDAPSISALLFQSFVEYESSYTPEGFAATTPGAAEVLRRISEGPVWIALSKGKLVGTVSAVPKEEALYVRGMAVLPSARGFQIGKLLMAEIERFALASGCKRLVLSTTPFLANAMALYERLGFARNAAGPDNLFGTPLFTMEKHLQRRRE